MNCWIILLLLCCFGNKNDTQSSVGNDCDCHDHHNHHNHCHNSCIQPRMYERETCDVNCERENECNDYEQRYTHVYNDSCGCAEEERSREKWRPYAEYNDNERRDCGCK